MVDKIILDCDPGHDDALAIMLAAGNPQIDLLAITTVAGNQTLEKVTRNALAVCTAAGITDVPIAAGAVYPLVRKQSLAPDIHGESGLDGPVLPEPTVALDPRHAVDLIIDVLMSHDPGTVTLVPTGPLTNIALAMRKEPRIIDRAKGVVLMGGSYTRGNRTPAAEFNIWADAEAAAAVFSGGWRSLTMIGLDLTHQALAEDETVRRIAAIGSPLGAFVTDVLAFFGSTYRNVQGFDHPPVHDPCCVAALIDPSVITTREAYVAVETAGQLTYGMTVTDFDGLLGQPVNAVVGTGIDNPRFWDLIVDALERLSATAVAE